MFCLFIFCCLFVVVVVVLCGFCLFLLLFVASYVAVHLDIVADRST